MSHARRVSLIPSIGSALGVRVFQIANLNATIVSSVSLKFPAELCFGVRAGRGAAAEARKAEGTSMLALLTPNPPVWTGRDACVH